MDRPSPSHHVGQSKDIRDFIVNEAPQICYYIPNFISVEEENLVLTKLYAAPKPKWVNLSNRRLQNWGGLPHPKGMIAEPIPDWLKKHVDSVGHLGLFDDKQPNHVLVNEYLPGQGIMPHEDGPLFYPTICTINIGGGTLLDFYLSLECNSNENEIYKASCNVEESHDIECSSKFEYKKIGSLLLERRSLLVLQSDLYTKYLHGISETKEDLLDENVYNIDKTSYSVGDTLKRDTRISLTIRHFPKVLKTKIFGTRGR